MEDTPDLRSKFSTTIDFQNDSRASEGGVQLKNRASEVERTSFAKHKSTVRRGDLAKVDFYKQEGWMEEFLEILFKIKERKSTIQLEVYYGLIHFISCCYILVVVPQQLSKAGYNPEATLVAIGACCGIGSIVGGLFTNLPFVIAPTSVVSIFVSVNLQASNFSSDAGSAAVVLSGIGIMFLFWRPLGAFIGKLIPLPIQVGTTLGVGLLTALAGADEINLVEKGEFALLRLGPITSEVVIAFAGLMAIGIALSYHVKGAFIIGLCGCSFVWWASQDAWPKGIASAPNVNVLPASGFNGQSAILVFELVFLYILYLSGLIPTLAELSKLRREDGSTPRGRWCYVIAGVMTIISGFLKSAPVLISPESSAGIKAGAKTGLSTLVCGLFFILTIFFSPLFQAVPPAATSPILIMIGVILFQDVNRLNWRVIEDALPAFVVLFFVPFTYSIFKGVILGYIAYMIMGFFTGSLMTRSIELVELYFPEVVWLLKEIVAYWKKFKVAMKMEERSPSVDVEAHNPSEIVQTDAVTNPIQLEVNETSALGVPSIRKSILFTYDRNAIRSVQNVGILEE